MTGDYTGYVNGTKIIRSFTGNNNNRFDDFKGNKKE
jgi:hypothetical protein